MKARAWFAKMFGFVNSQKQEQEFADELESHLHMHVEDNVKSGMTPDEARRQAVIKLGGIEQTKERHRAQRKISLLEIVFRDLRYGTRRLLKSPGLTIIAILSLALGIGANTAIFSLINTAALRPLPIKHPEQLVSLTNKTEEVHFPVFSYPNYKDFRDRNNVFDGLFAYRFAPLSMSHDGINERLWGYLVTGNYFEVLGVNAIRGRVITPDDDRLPGGHPVVVMSYQSWQQRFGSDPAIIGKNLIVNGNSYTVIGITPQGFFGTEIIASPELWFPMMMQKEIDIGRDWLNDRSVQNVFVQGRLKSGVTKQQAEGALQPIALQLEKEYPNENHGKRVRLSTPGFLGGAMRGMVLGFTGILMVVVGFVLLLACTNLANLLLARATARRKEIAVHLALGASRFRLVMQLMSESMLLAVASGICGLLLAFWLTKLAVVFKPPMDVPLRIDLHIDYRVLIFTFLISVVTGILIGLLPALQSTKVDVQDSLKDKTPFGAYHRSLLKSGLIILQVCLSLILLIGAGLMLRALQKAQSINLGFDPQNSVAVSFDLRLQGYNMVRGLEFQKQLLERLHALPEVKAAGIIDLVPVDLHFSREWIFIEGQSAEQKPNGPWAMTSLISPGYFQAMSTQIVRGRDFTLQDDQNSIPVVIINETFARRFWPGQDPIGKRFSQEDPKEAKMQVVGVVQDGKYGGLNEKPQPYFCRPIAQAYLSPTTVIVRARNNPKNLIPLVRNELKQLDPQLPIASAKLMTEKLGVALLPARVAATFLGSFGILALILAAIGIYGVMSYAVSTRTHEIGVRLALGANTSDVLRLTIGQGMLLVLIGGVIGLALALALTRLAKSLLFGVNAADPFTYVGVVMLLAAVALIACYIPARRATKIDPVIALRNE
ncbi:ABC transporter permease [bacterium]|nr:ABC transporter permease [bacterium]